MTDENDVCKMGVRGGISGRTGDVAVGGLGVAEEDDDEDRSVVRIVARSNGGCSSALEAGGVSQGGWGKGRYGFSSD
jgi:hypothetical protein